MVIFWVRAVLGRALESEAPTTATRLGRKNVSRSMSRSLMGRPVMSRAGPLLAAPVARVGVAMSLPQSLRSGGGCRPARSRAGPRKDIVECRAAALNVYDIRV